jgi:hypothetical protein
MVDIKAEKQRLREQVWKNLMEESIARFPLPVYGRIPNFEGAETGGKDKTPVRVNREARRRELLEALIEYIKETGRTPMISGVRPHGIMVHYLNRYLGGPTAAFGKACEECSRRYA